MGCKILCLRMSEFHQCRCTNIHHWCLPGRRVYSIRNQSKHLILKHIFWLLHLLYFGLIRLSNLPVKTLRTALILWLWFSHAWPSVPSTNMEVLVLYKRWMHSVFSAWTFSTRRFMSSSGSGLSFWPSSLALTWSWGESSFACQTWEIGNYWYISYYDYSLHSFDAIFSGLCCSKAVAIWTRTWTRPMLNRLSGAWPMLTGWSSTTWLSLWTRRTSESWSGKWLMILSCLDTRHLPLTKMKCKKPLHSLKQLFHSSCDFYSDSPDATLPSKAKLPKSNSFKMRMKNKLSS